MKLGFRKNRFRDRYGDTAILLTGFAIGAGAMYVFDPEAGAERRAAVGQTVTRGSGSAAHWISHKAAGAARFAWHAVSRTGKAAPQLPPPPQS
ncbi:MAG TPA: hypothetical protein VE998_09765 [Terriglobales bacterium]|nr:hypothetical protein [Terriglobales bacterium]